MAPPARTHTRKRPERAWNTSRSPPPRTTPLTILLEDELPLVVAVVLPAPTVLTTLPCKDGQGVSAPPQRVRAATAKRRPSPSAPSPPRQPCPPPTRCHAPLFLGMTPGGRCCCCSARGGGLGGLLRAAAWLRWLLRGQGTDAEENQRQQGEKERASARRRAWPPALVHMRLGAPSRALPLLSPCQSARDTPTCTAWGSTGLQLAARRPITPPCSPAAAAAAASSAPPPPARSSDGGCIAGVGQPAAGRGARGSVAARRVGRMLQRRPTGALGRSLAASGGGGAG